MNDAISLRKTHEDSARWTQSSPPTTTQQEDGEDSKNINQTSLSTELYLLKLILQYSLIPSNKNSSKYFLWLNNFICINLLLVACGVVIYVPVTTTVTKEHDLNFRSILAIFWYSYSSVSYTYLSYLSRCCPSIIQLLQEINIREKNNNFSDPCITKHPIKVLMCIGIVVILINSSIAIFVPGISDTIIGISHHPAFKAYVDTCVVFLSCGWMLPVPIVFLGCRILMNKIQYLTKYVEHELRSQNTEECPLDLVYAMRWHDVLYEKNRLLNDAISGIVTLSLCFQSLAFLCFGLYFAVSGFDSKQLFWFLVNTFTLCAMGFPTGELEIQNKLLGIQVGYLPFSKACAQSSILLHQFHTFSIKCERAEFGIFVKGTKILINFNAMIRIGSITLSGIVFFGGLARSV